MITRGFLSAVCVSALLAGCAKNEAEPNANWVAQIGGLGPEIVFDLTETSDGRLCATGTFFNKAEFGSGERAISLEAEHIQDIYLACYDARGHLNQAIQFGARQGDESRAIAALPNGDVVITGYFAHSFGAGRSGKAQASGGTDIFLSRINAQGEEVWTRRFGGKFADNGASVAVGADGNLLLAGNFQDIMTFKVGEKTRKLVSAGGRDAFVFKLNESGEVLWGRSFGGEARDEALRVAPAAQGRVLVAGTFAKEAGFNGADNGRLIALGNADAFVLALEADGELAWSRHIAGRNREHVGGLASDRMGNVFVAGNFLESIILPDGEQLTSAGSSDIFLLRFDHDGAMRWSGRLGGSEVDEIFDLDINAADRLLLSGYFQGDSDFSPGSEPHVLTSSGTGNSDGFVLALKTDGEVISTMQAAGAGVEMVFTVAALADGGIATAGLFNDDLKLSFTGQAPLSKRGKTDVFLARLGESTWSTSSDSAGAVLKSESAAP